MSEKDLERSLAPGSPARALGRMARPLDRSFDLLGAPDLPDALDLRDPPSLPDSPDLRDSLDLPDSPGLFLVCPLPGCLCFW